MVLSPPRGHSELSTFLTNKGVVIIYGRGGAVENGGTQNCGANSWRGGAKIWCKALEGGAKNY